MILAVLLGYLTLLATEFLGAFFVRGTIAGETFVFLSGLLAGLVTARVARAQPLLHAGVLAAVFVSVTLVVAAFSKRPTIPGIPPWYPYAATLLAGAGIFVGGALLSRDKTAE